jgi:hypothetical protein
VETTDVKVETPPAPVSVEEALAERRAAIKKAYDDNDGVPPPNIDLPPWNAEGALPLGADNPPGLGPGEGEGSAPSLEMQKADAEAMDGATTDEDEEDKKKV